MIGSGYSRQRYNLVEYQDRQIEKAQTCVRSAGVLKISGYSAKRITLQSSIIGFELIATKTSIFVDECILNCRHIVTFQYRLSVRHKKQRQARVVNT